MAGERAAIRYAKAVLSLANKDNKAEAVNNDMKLIVETLAKNEDLHNVLQSPVVRSSVKKSIVLSVFSDIKPNTSNLIDTLITNKRISILSNVASKYIQIYNELRGSQVATVTTAVEITADLKEVVLHKVRELTGKKVELKNVIDKDILGGFILRVGDIQYNASISSQLNKLRREFTLN
ncbi:ATP synthase F1 subunit delta [Yeosuana sp. MJ-SS3]|jgi:F-type H+-transporting ATPase subunit delta|uniref:ATP synthase subunit delta n=1 Tax=Gilvirhabdus luticola TaxID=3079858 RepID=A0ABU3U2I3_9FLAO|nr:ATP synthase F1 subunit delta [Yeosuana sp. MJ-SS3]MDU8884620.1 ATP synthase F1 subunit delta [Yeosuana sp. MJ-SS3]